MLDSNLLLRDGAAVLQSAETGSWIDFAEGMVQPLSFLVMVDNDSASSSVLTIR
jgi:hypothetical protein